VDWGGFVLLGVIAWLVIGLLVPRGGGRSGGRGDDGDDDDARGANDGAPASPHRVAQLCRALSGDPRRDRPVQNRILALGPGIVPLVLQEHAEVIRHPAGTRPGILARLEETVADFGLGAVPSVAAALARVQPTSPVALSLQRMLCRLGPGGAAPFLRAGLETPALAAYLPRWRSPHTTRDPAGVLAQVLRDRPTTTLGEDLDGLAGLAGEHPAVLGELWTRFSGDGVRAREVRQVLLRFQCQWLPLAQGALILRGLADPDPDVRLTAVRLADLVHEPGLLVDLVRRAASDPVPEIRAAAVRALGHAPAPDVRGALRDAASDPAVIVTIAARHALRRVAPQLTLPVPDDPAARGALDLLAASDARAVDPLLAGLEAASPLERRLATELLGEHVGADPRAKERLFRAVEGRDPELAATAVLALARAGEPEAAELLARQIRDAVAPDVLHILQETAQVLGPAATVPLARRLRPDAGGRVDVLLAVLRTVPYAQAVPPLLRALEAARATRAEGPIAATLAIGGPAVRAALDAGIQQPGRGLLTPALVWLAAYATPADLPVLLELLDRHPPLRGIVLGIIEALGEPAREALKARIARGGDDATLAAVEERLALLEACHAVHETA
jgi:hypothetical protein